VTPLAYLRLFGLSWKFHLRDLTRSGFYLLVSVLQPVIFASIAFFMWRSGARPGSLLDVALGVGLMGMWSSTLFGAGSAIQRQRWQGTLELLVAAPAPFGVTAVSLTVATASLGFYSIAATLLWARLLFGVPLRLTHPLAFAIALLATAVSLGLLGLILASTFVLYRHGAALSNMLEYPVWLVTGLLVPLSLLPGWTHPIAWLLAPTWGVQALRRAALGGQPWPAVGACLALGALYLLIGALTLRNFERLARRAATLALT
jgi:ABC-2 type transport system permease protein